MSNEFSSLLAAGFQGARQVENRSKGGEESIQRTSAAIRLQESRSRAEKAAGVGTVENETQRTFSDKDGDGRLFASANSSNNPDNENNKNSHDDDNRSIDLSGQIGTHLDYLC